MYNQIAIKTSAGLDRIHNVVNTEMPRPLRNLLIMVDDKSTVDKYRLRLKNYTSAEHYGGVSSMFETLEEMDLIQLQSPSRQNPAPAQQEEPVTTTNVIKLNPEDFVDTEEFIGRVRKTIPMEDTLANFRNTLIKLIRDTDHKDRNRYIEAAEGISNPGDLFRTIKLVWDNIRSGFTRAQRKRTRLLYHVAKKAF